MKSILVPAAVALLAALASPAPANMISNGTLDLPDNPALFTHYPTYEIVQITPTTHAHVIAGWTIGGDSIDVITRQIWRNNPVPDCVDLVGTSGPGSISRTVAGLTPGDSYQLSVDLAANPSNGKFGGESAITKWLDISITNSTTPNVYFKANAGNETVQNIEWITRTVTFTATSTTADITFAAIFPQHLPKTFTDGTPLTTDNFYAGPVIANLNLESTSGAGNPRPPAPEPTTLLLLTPVWGSVVWSSAFRRRRTPMRSEAPTPR